MNSISWGSPLFPEEAMLSRDAEKSRDFHGRRRSQKRFFRLRRKATGSSCTGDNDLRSVVIKTGQKKEANAPSGKDVGLMLFSQDDVFLD
jgi:hypothetical protein